MLPTQLDSSCTGKIRYEHLAEIAAPEVQDICIYTGEMIQGSLMQVPICLWQLKNGGGMQQRAHLITLHLLLSRRGPVLSRPFLHLDGRIRLLGSSSWRLAI